RFVACETHLLAAVGAIEPQFVNAILLPHDHVCVRIVARDFSKCPERSRRNCFKQCGVSDQSDAFKVAIDVATSVKRSAIERTNQTVIPDETYHCYRVEWSLIQELNHFALRSWSERLYAHVRLFERRKVDRQRCHECC